MTTSDPSHLPPASLGENAAPNEAEFPNAGTPNAGVSDAGAPATGTSDAATPAQSTDREPAVSPVAHVETEATAHADLWAFAFREPALSQEALMAALRLTAKGHLKLDDAVIVTKDDRGKVRLMQTRETTPFQAALSGSWLGLFAGLFVPGGPLIPMALGAAAGGLFAKLRDKGINDDEMKSWGEHLDDGSAALFLLVEDCHQVRALHEVGRFEATVLTSTASPDLVATVRERLAINPWDL